MKLLLDENIPFHLYKDFPREHQVFSVNYMKWNAMTNGELLRVMTAEGFNALVTWDQNISYQQNFRDYPITVFVFCTSSNDYAALSPLVPKILKAIREGMKPGAVVIYEEEK